MIVVNPAEFSDDRFSQRYYSGLVSSLNVVGAGAITVSAYAVSGSHLLSNTTYNLDIGNPSAGNVVLGAYSQRSVCVGNLYIGTTIEVFGGAGITTVILYQYWPNSFLYAKYFNETALRYMSTPEMSFLAMPVQIIRSQAAVGNSGSLYYQFAGVKITW